MKALIFLQILFLFCFFLDGSDEIPCLDLNSSYGSIDCAIFAENELYLANENLTSSWWWSGLTFVISLTFDTQSFPSVPYSIAVPQNQTELYMTWEKNCPNKGSTVISSMSSFNVTTGSVADNWFNQLGICSISNLLTTSNYDLICFVGIAGYTNQFGVFQCVNYTSNEFINTFSPDNYPNISIQLLSNANDYFNFGASFSPSPLANSLAFWISDYYGFGIYFFTNVSNYNSFIFTRIYSATSTVYGIDFDNVNNLLYVGIGNTLQIFSVANYTNPQSIYSYETNKDGFFGSVVLRNSQIYSIFTSPESGLSEFMLFSISPSTNPSELNLIYQLSLSVPLLSRDHGLFVSENGSLVLLIGSQSILYMTNENGMISILCGQEMIANSTSSNITSSYKRLIAAIVAPIFGVLIVGIAIFFVLFYQKHWKQSKTRFIDNKEKEEPTFSSLILKGEKVEINGVIGKGEKAIVYKGSLFGSPIALKKITSEKEAQVEALTSSKISTHPNILRFLGIHQVEHSFYLCFELMTSNLQIYLEKHENISLDILYRFILEISAAMTFLHQHQFIHRDLSSRNLLISPLGKLKLGDFGLAVRIKESEGFVDTSGFFPIKWSPPEAFINGIFSFKSDVWSFGVTCYEIFSNGSEPYLGMSNQDVKKYVKSGKTLEHPKNCADDLWKLIQTNCFAFDPSARTSFIEFDQKFKECIKYDYVVQMKDNSFYVHRVDQDQSSVDLPQEWAQWEKQTAESNFYFV